MGIEKVTWMKLTTASLDSEKNFSKVKKTLCGIPQIRDQSFDEKNNTVTIKVVCCSPEKIMQKLCSKGRGAIKRIETIDPPKGEAPKPKEAEKPKEAPKPKEPEKPQSKEAPKPKEPEKPKPAETGQSSQPMMGQPMTMTYYQPAPIQEYGYPSRPIYDSYGNGYGVPPQPNQPYYGRSGFDAQYFSDENAQGCIIM